ncbi:DUF4249 domain-containing protein [Fulvivirga sedimenti]|uniref:DUF4249 domain-containing protein n=1 Tax=Fulvivirga sedimenti TaxID=2879465 RepID=A0A9X1KWU4_9BACT|nr:DUF4249 domain-containing protein [Fulvivirga sedimenti]MCA6073607.1 DUF4249 domain-containing protein [Fulvivirga sedimenti]
MMKKVLHIPLVAIVMLIACWACEDQVTLDLPDAPPVLVVDAFLNDKPGDQKIILTMTQPYFSNSLPTGVSGAVVQVEDDLGNIFTFNEGVTAGEYIWSPQAGELIGTVGRTYQLTVENEGTTYQAVSEMKRVPEVDSVFFTFKEDGTPFQETGYYAEFRSMDFVGPGDFYWIKAYKNDTLLIRPFELNIAADAGFTPGGNIDGVVFIQPIQDAVNPLNDDLDQILPFVQGDSLYVEIHSITADTWEFLNQVRIQTQRDGGFDEIFAEPLENVPTNIVITDSPASEPEPVVGYFSVSAVKGNGRRLNE